MMGNGVVGGIVAVIIAVAVVVIASRKRQGSDGSDDSVKVQRMGISAGRARLEIKSVALAFVAGFGCLYAIYAVAARDEIYYLCGNFKQGVSYASVVRQLETSSLSGYLKKDTGDRVVHSSMFHLHAVKCTIRFDANQDVTRSVYSVGW